MREAFTRGVIWHGAELIIQEERRPDSSEIFGFPGAIVLPKERPLDVIVADLSRKLDFDFSEVSMGEARILEDEKYEAAFFETALPYNSITKRKNFHFWYMDQVYKALGNNQLAPLSAKYIERFFDGAIDN
jgi:hypothetical protein